MLESPEVLLAIVKEAVATYPDDIHQQKGFAKAQIAQMNDSAEITAYLVEVGLMDMIYRERAHGNIQIKQSFQGGQPAKVTVGNGAANAAMAMSLFDMKISGRSLGDILGKELKGLAANEQELAKGHTKNARLLLALAAVVPDDKRVRDSISEAKARKLAEQSYKSPKAARQKVA